MHLFRAARLNIPVKNRCAAENENPHFTNVGDSRISIVMKSLGLILGFLSAITAFAADVIPAARRHNTTVGDSIGYGVPGGIYQYRGRTIVNATGLTDTTGGTDYTATIQAQIDALSPGQCLLLPAGTFRLNSTINVGVKAGNAGANPNVTLRGAGIGQTILMLYGGGVSVSGGGGFPTYYPSAAYLTADTPAGATTLQLTESASDAVGLHCLIDGYHDPSAPVVNAGGDSQLRPTLLRLTGASGNTATFYPALPFALKAGARFTRELGTGPPNYVTHVSGLGLEDLTVDGINTNTTVLVGQFSTVNSWIYNVEAKNVTNFGISSAFNIQSSIIHCKVHDHIDSYPTYTTRNLLVMAASTLMLVEDNLIYNGFSATEFNAGVILSAISHNFMDRICIRDTISSVFNINHGSHNSFNTYEGNIASRIQSDGYFGSSSDETFHRNWFHGTNGVYTTDWATSTVVNQNRLPITLNRWSRRFNIVGNLIGRTGVGVTWDYTNLGAGFDTTSTTSLSIGTGDKVFTLGTGLGYNNNGTGALAYSASDPTKYMAGKINNYNASTGVCTMAVTRANGSGTVNDWVVKGGGGYGSNVLLALGGPNIGNGGFWWGSGAVVAPQTNGIWWAVWDGRRMNKRGAFNSGTVYNQSGSGPTGSADVVGYYAPGPYAYNQNSAVTDWIANNPAKSGTATWATPGPNQTDWLPIASNSYQELDHDVYGTAIIKDNWNAATSGIHASEALSSDTYPVSRIRSGSTRPAFFGSSLTYPAFDSHNPNQSFAAIPAGYRYINNGAEVPGYSPNDSLGPPPAAPAAPSDVAATASSSSQIGLTWTDNSTNESGFRILRGTSAGTLSEIGYVGPGVTSYAATGLSAATQYFFKVEAYNAGGSAASNTANATTQAGAINTPPPTPSTPSRMPTIIRVQSVVQ